MDSSQYQPTQRPEKEGEVKVLIPLYIPLAALQNNFHIKMAKKYCQWSERVVLDGEEVDNPVSAVDAYAERIKAFVKEEARAMLAEEGAEQGRQAALSQFDALFGG